MNFWILYGRGFGCCSHMKRSKTYQVCDCRHWELSPEGNAGLGLLSITASTASMEIRFRWRLSMLCSLERRTNASGPRSYMRTQGLAQSTCTSWTFPADSTEFTSPILVSSSWECVYPRFRASHHLLPQVFGPIDDEDHEHRKEPNSVSKLPKGDAAFVEIKRCLGWDYVVKSKTLLVAPPREEKVL